jgi:hypothetical protein
MAEGGVGLRGIADGLKATVEYLFVNPALPLDSADVCRSAENTGKLPIASRRSDRSGTEPILVNLTSLLRSLIVPCSFPVTFPVRMARDSRLFRHKMAPCLALRPWLPCNRAPRDAKLPANFPVNGNSVAETGSHESAYTATHLSDPRERLCLPKSAPRGGIPIVGNTRAAVSSREFASLLPRVSPNRISRWDPRARFQGIPLRFALDCAVGRQTPPGSGRGRSLGSRPFRSGKTRMSGAALPNRGVAARARSPR